MAARGHEKVVAWKVGRHDQEPAEHSGRVDCQHGSSGGAASGRLARWAPATPWEAFGLRFVVAIEDSGHLSQALLPSVETREVLGASGWPWSLGVKGRTAQRPPQWPSRPPGWAKCHMFEAWQPSPRTAGESSSADVLNQGRSVFADNAIAMGR